MPLHLLPLLTVALVTAGCASHPQPHAAHGTITTLSAANSENYERCQHKVPKEVCTRCNPHLTARFKAANDWCVEHGLPESQCLECHPDLTFAPLPALPPGSDLAELSRQGEDVASLEAHAVKGKVTLFDFYAVWCAPCRTVDAHLFPQLGTDSDIAVRKLNVVSWDTPLAARYLHGIPSLPYIVVFGKDGRRRGAIAGLNIVGLDRAIAEARAK